MEDLIVKVIKSELFDLAYQKFVTKRRTIKNINWRQTHGKAPFGADHKARASDWV